LFRLLAWPARVNESKPRSDAAVCVGVGRLRGTAA
jgi:hypothetical protein